MDNNQEANLVSFKVVLTRDGTIMTEFSHLPLGHAEKIFHKEDFDVIARIISEGRKKLEPMHEYIEKEIQSI